MRGEHSKVDKSKEREEWQKDKRQSGKPNMWRYNGLGLTEEEIRAAMKNSRSNREAARWLDVTHKTYKKYASSFIDLDTGKTLFEIHSNPSGVGIPKRGAGNTGPTKLTDADFKEGQVYSSTALARLKATLMASGELGYTCACCGYAEKRVSDMRVPLLLNFKNGKKSDWRKDNLRWVCYNCSFLIGLDYFSDSLMQNIEHLVPEKMKDMNVVDRVQKFYDMEEVILEQFKEVGLTLEKKQEVTKIDHDLSDLISYI